MKHILQTDLYCIVGEEFSKGRSNIEVVSEMLSAGIKVIQYREKDKKPLYKYHECMEIRKLTKANNAMFIVNDDIDIAMAVEADGIHIGQEDLPIEQARRLVGQQMVIGLSTHSPEQGKEAVVRGADYIGVGPIYRTYTKKDVCEPVGLEYLDYVVKHLNIPFVAIGGIKEHNIREITAGGAKCICMVTEILQAESITNKIVDIRARIAGEAK